MKVNFIKQHMQSNKIWNKCMLISSPCSCFIVSNLSDSIENDIILVGRHTHRGFLKKNCSQQYCDNNMNIIFCVHTPTPLIRMSKCVGLPTPYQWHIDTSRWGAGKYGKYGKLPSPLPPLVAHTQTQPIMQNNLNHSTLSLLASNPIFQPFESMCFNFTKSASGQNHICSIQVYLGDACNHIFVLCQGISRLLAFCGLALPVRREWCDLVPRRSQCLTGTDSENRKDIACVHI